MMKIITLVSIMMNWLHVGLIVQVCVDNKKSCLHILFPQQQGIRVDSE